MHLSVKKFLGTALALGLAAFGLGAQSAAPFGNLPLWFEAGAPAKFTAHTSESEFIITPAGAEFTLVKKSGETAGCQLRFAGANPAAHISGDRKLSGTVNYLIGNDSSQWHTNVPTFAQVRVEDIYPGINVVYYGNRQKLEYDFNLDAGINPSAIALHFDGAEKISVDAQGELVIAFGSGEVIQHPPVAYQTVHSARREIAAGYKIVDAHTAAFVLGEYDRSQPLVIDPVLSYSSYFGGNSGDAAWAIAVNTNDDSIYVAGQTFSTKDSNNVPTLTFSSSGAYQTNYFGGRQAGDAFIARFDNSGTNLIYATYLGGNADDAAYAIAVDNNGNAFVAGGTISTNFPVKNPLPGGNKISGIINSKIKLYPTDIFIAELDSSGSNLLYSTYLGGNNADSAFGIALDSDDNAYITGFTYSTNFPVTPNAYQLHPAFTNTVLNANAFVAEIGTNGPTLNYSTYLGGTNYDVGHAIAYNNGMLFVAGYTLSTNFPVTNWIPETNIVETITNISKKSETNIFNSTNVFSGRYLDGISTNQSKSKKIYYAFDAFVTAFTNASPTNLNLVYSTFLGGTNNDQATGIAADANGNAYVVGYTSSTNFPDTVPDVVFSYVHTNTSGRYAIGTNGFLTKIQWDGTNTSIGYSAMFGGYGADVANGVALDSVGDAYVVGSASSTNFPTYNTGGDLSATNHYIKKRFKSDAVIIAFNTNASALLYSAYIGGDDNDYGNAIAVLTASNNVSTAYIAGQTISTNFPTINALQSDRNGKSNDMFIAEIQFALTTPLLVIEPGILKPAIQGKIAGQPSSEQPAVSLKWPMSTENYNVESSTDLTGWHPAPATAAYSNGWYHVTLPTTNGMEFFRLHKP